MAGQSRHACLQVTATADQTIGLTYIALDGDIGCMVNGAGLAMANMEIFGDVMSGSIFMKGTVGVVSCSPAKLDEALVQAIG